MSCLNFQLERDCLWVRKERFELRLSLDWAFDIFFWACVCEIAAAVHARFNEQ